MVVTEREVFKECLKNLTYLKDHSEEVLKTTKSVDKTYAELLKMFYRVWSGYTKYIRS